MLILASASPRRKELLSLITTEFEVCPAEIEETLPEGIASDEVAEYLAIIKCLDVAKKFPKDTVIGCDTVVVKDGILGKPADSADAKRMLKVLSGTPQCGTSHSVYTGVCIFKAGKTLSFTEETIVTFAEIPESLMDDYIKTGSPFDKAGGYGIQDDLVKLFTKSIVGNYENVMGLPVASLYKRLF
ncbi:MAG: Maf family protein [Ruminococcus sp.]|jgi:septum formation protein|nr:Maf family protein [Ruminococcus sp.]